jgi:beta-galactosidase/beta-glucuronidase
MRPARSQVITWNADGTPRFGVPAQASKNEEIVDMSKVPPAGEVRPYPRPDFERSDRWLSLDGPWAFAPDPLDHGRRDGWEQPGRAPAERVITVPFAWESPASGIGTHWMHVGWYARHVELPAAWTEARTILHIGAAHYATEVWLNGKSVGRHSGGYLPFAFDLTDALRDGEGDLVIRVEAPVDKRFIPHGKQHSRPRDDYDDCCFTPSSGIWQAVWVEARPATYVETLQLRAAAGLNAIEVRVTVAGPHAAEATVTVEVPGEGRQAVVFDSAGHGRAIVTIAAPWRWSPASPRLYDVVARLESPDGSDLVRGYTGLRSIEARDGHLFLNGERLYVRGVLDQGYWPRTGYTAPDDGALRRDVELTLAAGYNLARKHIKLEDPRWLYWADRLGLLVWEEPPCVGRFTAQATAVFEDQLERMVERDGNHPCTILWGIYNEEWGLDFLTEQDEARRAAVRRAYDKLARADGSRPIIDDSGWSHVKTDVLDWHYYDDDIRSWAAVTAGLATDALSPFGHQIGPRQWYETLLSVTGSSHEGLPILNGEYGGGATDFERGWHLRWQTQELRRHDGMDGYVYTEIFDVEHELCGIYTADRRLKVLGCDPADVNADTVIIFDLLPLRPGCDIVVEGASLDFDVRISHRGPRAIMGVLACGWEESGETISEIQLSIRPCEITPPVHVTCPIPSAIRHGKLVARLLDGEGRQVARAFLDMDVEPAV